MKNIATQLITQKFCKFFYLLACLAIFSNINASTTITFNDQDVSSVVTAFTLLQQRQTDDPIAQEIVAKSAQTLKGKVAALHQFNERLRKRQEENQKLSAQGLSPVRAGEDYASKLLARKAAEAEAAAVEMQRKLQADMDEEREQQRREIERKEKLLQEQEDALAKIKDQVQVLTATLSPLKKELAQERARERATPVKKQLGEVTAREAALAAELKRLKSQMGGDVLETILEERPDSSDDGFASGGVAGGGVNLDEEDPLKLELASYYGKIKGINKRLAKLAEVLSDCERVQALYDQSLEFVTTTSESIEEKFGKKTVTRVITSRFIPDSEVAQVLMRMSEACGIANKYKTTAFEGKVYEVRAEKDGVVEIANGTKKAVKAGELYEKFAYGTKEKMEKATPEERVTIFNDAFLNIYTEIPNNEKMKIGTIDHLQLSLDLTLNLEASILSTKKLGVYADSDFLSIDQTITNAISNLRAKIEERDKAVFNEYMSILAQERTLLESVTDFSAMPLTVQLLRDYRVLFMLKRPKKADEVDNELTTPFASFVRVLEEIQYLTENQKKALFASLYYAIFNYEEVSSHYLRDTLLSNTPIQAIDIHPLIKQVKEALKTNSAAEPFKPIAMTQNDLRAFSTKVHRLIVGDTYRESVTNRFASALNSLGQKFNGISQEGILEYLKTEDLSEAQNTKARRILAEYEFISRETLNQQFEAKKILLITHKTEHKKSTLEKEEKEAEAVSVTIALEEATLAKTNAQREKKEKQDAVDEFAATIPEHADGYVLTQDDKVQLVVLDQKLEELEELNKRHITHNKHFTELDKKRKKLVEQIECLTKQIKILEDNIAVLEPEIENLAAELKKVRFVPVLDQYADDMEKIASRGYELFEFSKELDSCFELLTALQASTIKLVRARAEEDTAITSARAIASSAADKLGHEARSKIEAVLLKARPDAHPQSAAARLKKLKTMAKAATKEKREADALAAAAAVKLPKPIARPSAFAAPVASSSVVDAFRNIVNVAKAKLATLTAISADDREEIQSLIDSVNAEIESGKTTFTGMKTKKLEKNAHLVAVVLPPPPQTAEVVVAELPKPPARPAVPTASMSDIQAFQMIVNASMEKLATLTAISEDERQEIQNLIGAINADIDAGKTTMLTGVKISNLKKKLAKL